MTTYPVAYPLTQRPPLPLDPHFPAWQREYEAAVHEADVQKLLGRVHAAEAAIFKRLQELAENSGQDHDAEHRAIADALCALRVLSRDKLQFPDWKGK